MRNSRRRWLPAMLATTLVCGMISGLAQDPGKRAREMWIAAASQNIFGLKLLANEAARHPRQNVFLSPLSIYLALAMTESGAAGETRAAMRRTLAVPAGMSEDALHEAASALSKELRSRKDLELSVANALWSDTSMPFAPAFVKHCRDFYEAEAKTIDFHKPDAADIINAWVRRKTQDKIPAIVTPDVVAMSKAILTNAVYFKAAWLHQFSKGETTDGAFHLASGKSKTVPLMHHASLAGAYRSGDGFEAAELPYGNSRMVLYAILPAPGSSPEQALTKVVIEKLIASTASSELDLRLPRFALDFSTRLKEPLTSMGMGIAFRYPGAEFAPLGSPLFFIGEVLHKTRLEINEEGTMAAAVTAVTMKDGHALRAGKQKKVLVFDRPFGLLLCDTVTGTVLFEGVVNEP